jgi:hypothetical protein
MVSNQTGHSKDENKRSKEIQYEYGRLFQRISFVEHGPVCLFHKATTSFYVRLVYPKEDSKSTKTPMTQENRWLQNKTMPILPNSPGFD